jgi:hypothetical protein
MDSISAKHDTPDDGIDTLRALCDIKSQMDEIPVINDSDLNSRLALLQRIHDCVEKLIKDNICKPLIEIPHPLPPMKLEDECRKENCNDTCNQKE